jgi:hypothetical protein
MERAGQLISSLAPQNGLRAIRAGAQGDKEFLHQALHAIMLDTDERLSIDSRRAAVARHPPPGFPQDVTPVDPIQQRMEAALRRSLVGDPETTFAVGALCRSSDKDRGRLEPGLPVMPSYVLAPSTCPP